MEQTVSIILKDLGVRPGLQGYAMLRDAIIMNINKDTKAKLRMTKDIYPKLADMYASTSTRVERAMRHAIETAFNELIPDKRQREIFGSTIGLKHRPTVGDFIATIADYILNMHEFPRIVDVLEEVVLCQSTK